jgi:NADH dehydrogenase (ubiquinone) 1 beta subcomplex subunit 3
MAVKGSLDEKVSRARFAEAAGARADSSRSEAWRYTGPFTRWNRFKGAFPGFGIAAVAFTGYVIFEQLFLKDSHGHDEGSGHH